MFDNLRQESLRAPVLVGTGYTLIGSLPDVYVRTAFSRATRNYKLTLNPTLTRTLS